MELFDDPNDKALCEIMTVYHNVSDGFFCSVARVKDDKENQLLNMTDLHHHRVFTTNGSPLLGTQELTRQYHQSLNVDYQEASWSQTTEEWIAEQC